MRCALINSGSESRERHGFETHLNLPMDVAGRRRSMSTMSSWGIFGAKSVVATGIWD